MTPTTKRGSVASTDKREDRIPSRVADLASPDPAVRTKTREALVAIGKLTVPSLIQLLSHRKPHVRWEAAKSLCAIADPLAAFALVNALDDRDGDAPGVVVRTRWGFASRAACTLLMEERCHAR